LREPLAQQRNISRGVAATQLSHGGFPNKGNHKGCPYGHPVGAILVIAQPVVNFTNNDAFEVATNEGINIDEFEVLAATIYYRHTG
jgi:hypothetical protein